jgi:regulator of RNase E activity RraA
VIPQELTVEVLLEAEERNKAEDNVRRLILEGASLGDLYQEVEVF